MKGEHLRWFAWQPIWEAWFPLLFALLVIGGIWLGGRRLALAEVQALFWLIAALCILLPGLHTWWIKRRPPDFLGITEQNWPQALGAGLVLGILLGAAQVYYGLFARHELFIPALNLELVVITLAVLLVAAGEEMLFRAWFQRLCEPAWGLVPTFFLASLAYAALLLVFWGSQLMPLPILYLPAGHVPGLPFFTNLGLVFCAALMLNVLYRVTHSLWTSVLANVLSRLALLFVWPYQTLVVVPPALMAAVVGALWALAIIFLMRWRASFAPPPAPTPAPAPPPPKPMPSPRRPTATQRPRGGKRK
jgi:membrane protease YdiL (CAAX protease family)